MKNFFWLYVVVASITTVLGVLAGIIPGLSQPLLALAGLKWAFFFMLSYATFCLSGFNIYWAIAFAFEVILSFGSYFSDYKTVFFFSVFGLVAAQKRFSGRAYFGMTVFAASLLTMSVIWTSIKSDYRHFASGGQAAQVVTVGFDQRMAKLGELVSNLDGAAMRVGLDQLVRRVAYLEFFAQVINNVPSRIPHEGGAIWWDAIVRPFTPRLFFPEKSQIDDSVRTSAYTGFHHAGAEAGVSISIGYMGESYIDFGAIGMLPVIAAYGYFLGRIYRYFATSDGLLGMSFATAIIYGAAPFETSITKAFGGIIVKLVVSWLLIRIVIPKYARWAIR